MASSLLFAHASLANTSTLATASQLVFFSRRLVSSSRTSQSCELRPRRRPPGFWTQPSQLATAAKVPTPAKKNTGTRTCCLRCTSTSTAWKRREKEEVSAVCYDACKLRPQRTDCIMLCLRRSSHTHTVRLELNVSPLCRNTKQPCAALLKRFIVQMVLLYLV